MPTKLRVVMLPEIEAARAVVTILATSRAIRAVVSEVVVATILNIIVTTIVRNTVLRHPLFNSIQFNSIHRIRIIINGKGLHQDRITCTATQFVIQCTISGRCMVLLLAVSRFIRPIRPPEDTELQNTITDTVVIQTPHPTTVNTSMMTLAANTRIMLEMMTIHSITTNTTTIITTITTRRRQQTIDIFRSENIN